jgi:hypothetical protein
MVDRRLAASLATGERRSVRHGHLTPSPSMGEAGVELDRIIEDLALRRVTPAATGRALP